MSKLDRRLCPMIQPKPKQANVHARIPAELKARVLAECERQGISLTQVIQHYFQVFLDDTRMKSKERCGLCGELTNREEK